MEDGDFPWFFASKAEPHRKSLLRAAQKDANIACFVQREQADIEAREKLWAQRKENATENLTGIRLSRWLAQQADQETVERYARIYCQQTEPHLRAQALEAFHRCPYPDDPQPIIEDTRASCEQLQQAAWNALENIRHPQVRRFALDNVSNRNGSSEIFSLLVTNYQPKDSKLIEDLLLELIRAKDWDSVHWAGWDIYRAFYRGSGIPHPKHLLPLMYEYNPCSYCRQTAVEYLAQHRMLTKEILEECLYDSNADIRTMAARKLNR